MPLPLCTVNCANNGGAVSVDLCAQLLAVACLDASVTVYNITQRKGKAVLCSVIQHFFMSVRSAPPAESLAYDSGVVEGLKRALEIVEKVFQEELKNM